MASTTINPKSVQTVKPFQWIALAVVYLLIPLVFWICGGDLGWWQAWVYSTLIIIAGVGMRIWANLRHPGLEAERAKFGKAQDVKGWDKILAPLVALSVGFPLYIIAGLDHRFHWSPIFLPWINILGLILCAIGYCLAGWALIENRFFSSVVRIQTERGHAVCDSGPYRFIRHPGYSGNIWPLAGIVLALNSLWAIIPAAIALALILTRTELEDRTLRGELPGYSEYTQQVHYKLIPWIY